MKTSKLLIPLFSTILFAFGTVSSASTISTNQITPNSNNKLAGNFGEAKDGSDLIGQPIREMADPYFSNIWYASLYPQVKEDIDRNHSGGNRINQYIRICSTIARNKRIIFDPGAIIYIPIFTDVHNYGQNRLTLVVKEENGLINCYQRVPQFPK